MAAGGRSRASHSTSEKLRVEHGIVSDSYLRMKFIVEPEVPLCQKVEGVRRTNERCQ